EILKRLAPEYVTPGVVFLCSEEAPTGAILTAGAGAFALARIYETEGVYLGEGGLSVEEVRDNWAKITDEAGQKAYVAGGEQSQKLFRKMSGGRRTSDLTERTSQPPLRRHGRRGSLRAEAPSRAPPEASGRPKA